MGIIHNSASFYFGMFNEAGLLKKLHLIHIRMILIFLLYSFNILTSDKDFRLLISCQAPFRVPVRGRFEWPAIVPQKPGGGKRFFGWSDRPPRPTIARCPIMMRTFFYLKVVDLRLAVQPPPITSEAAMNIQSTFCTI